MRKDATSGPLGLVASSPFGATQRKVQVVPALHDGTDETNHAGRDRALTTGLSITLGPPNRDGVSGGENRAG